MCARINRFSFAVFEQLFQVFQEFNHNPCCWLDAIQKLCCSLTKVLELDYSSFWLRTQQTFEIIIFIIIATVDETNGLRFNNE